MKDSRCVVIAIKYLCLMDQERSLGVVGIEQHLQLTTDYCALLEPGKMLQMRLSKC